MVETETETMETETETETMKTETETETMETETHTEEAGVTDLGAQICGQGGVLLAHPHHQATEVTVQGSALRPQHKVGEAQRPAPHCTTSTTHHPPPLCLPHTLTTPAPVSVCPCIHA